MTIPASQYAIQLTGPGQLALSTTKPVHSPGPHQVLARIECVGLCFSDMKLLKQFDRHARKGAVVSGLSAEILASIPSYVPGSLPTVPGHEVTARIVAVGPGVTRHAVGARILVQADYRDLPTASSSAAFGYNFEGALQEYVLMDERVVIDRSGESFLLDVPEEQSASALALVEPWACVEDSYVSAERQCPLVGGRLLIVADAGVRLDGLACLAAAKPSAVTAVLADAAQREALAAAGLSATVVALSELPREFFDDIIYFGATKAVIEALNDPLAARGLCNVVLGGRRIGSLVAIGVGRVHYGLTRWIGTTGHDAAESYRHIPANGELRPGDAVVVVGAGGPMGQMHALRTVCSGIGGLSLTTVDHHDRRLESLGAKVLPLARLNGVPVTLINAHTTAVPGPFSYHALMAPKGELITDAIRDSLPGAIINLFAGIPAPVRHELDLDRYITQRIYLFGTSGSTNEDMRLVLGKVVKKTFDTDVSVDAICGMRGVTAGIAAMEQRSLAGKIVVYPWLRDAGLIPLADLATAFPTVHAKLERGAWGKAAEDELKRVAGFRSAQYFTPQP